MQYYNSMTFIVVPKVFLIKQLNQHFGEQPQAIHCDFTEVSLIQYHNSVTLPYKAQLTILVEGPIWLTTDQ